MAMTVAEIQAKVTVDTSQLDSGMAKAASTVESFGQKVNSATSSMETVGKGMAAVGAAGGVMFGAALNSAAGFEQQMDFVGSALGGVGDGLGATEAQFASLSAQAMELGSSTQYSANQVGQVQEALAKTGVSAEDLLSGATSAVLDLSAATGEDLVASANVAAGAMNTFGLSGEDLGRIADVTTGALNNSSMSLADFSTGMNYLSPILAQTGGDFDDAAAAIAYFNSQGMKGADAGVSLARMIDNLVRPKNLEAAALFKELGISAFDAEGQMKPVPDMLDNIQQALQGLNEQEQLELVSKLFGAESADVVLRALSGAGQGIRDMNEDITQQGIAAEQAAQRMDNWKGDLETLGGAINAAGMNITNAFLPALRSVTQFATQVVDAFNDLPAPIQAAVGALLAVGSAVTGGLGAALLIIPKIMEFKTAFTALKTGLDLASLGMKGFMASLGPIGIALAVVSVAVLAYQTNFLGFGDAVDSVVAKVTTFASQFGQIFDMFSNGSDAASGLTQRIEGFGQAVEFMTGLPVAEFFSGIASALDESGNHFASVTARISELMGAGFTPLQAAVRALREEFPAFSGAIATVGTLFQNLLDTVSGVAAGLMSAFDALRNGDLSGVFQGLLAAGQAAVTGLLNHFRILGGGILQAFGAIDWSAISATLQVGLQNASTALQTWFGTISQNLQTWFTSIDWGVIGGMLSSGLQTAIAAMGDVASLLLTKGADLITGLATGFAQAWPTVQTWLATLPTLIGAAITVSGDVSILLLQKGVDLITGLLTGLQQKWPEVQTWIGTAFTDLGPTITTAMATVTTAASTAWGAMKTDATTKIEELKTEVLGKWDTLRTEIVNKLTDLQTTLAATFDGLKVDIPAKVTELVTNATAQFETLKTDAMAKMEELKTAAIESATSLATEAAAQFETLATNATAKVEELKASATESFTSLKTEAVQLVTDLGLEALAQFEILKTNATAKIEELKTAAAASFTAMKTEAVQLVTDLGLEALAQFEILKTNAIAKAVELKDGFVTEMKNLATEALTAISGLKDTIVNFFADAGTWLVSAGQAIGQGLIDGLGSMKDSVGDAAGTLANNATSAVTGALGIRSPSKVFHGIGVDTAQGFANGIEAGEGAVAQAVAALIERITGVVADRLGALNGDLSEGGRRAGKTVVDGVNEATGDISEYEVGSDQWRQALENKIASSMDRVGKKGGDSVNTGVKSKKRDHEKAMGEFLDAGVDYGLKKAEDAEDIGVMAANAINGGLKSGQQDVVTTAGKIATQVVNEFGDRVQAFYDIGKNYMEGLALGMRAGASDVEEAANDIGKSAEKELRKATESQSPSKAAHRVGEDVARGFAGGIASGEEMTKKAARQLWKAAWKELKENIKEAGFLGADWAVEFWQGMLNSPDMTGPLAAWITEQMVNAADTALKKIQAEIAGIAAQLDIARNLPDPDTTIPQVPQPNVPQPEPVDTSAKDILQAQLDATRELTDAIEKAFTKAFSEAHKAHIAFAQGTISEQEYLSKYQAAQNAYDAKVANAEKIASLEAQVKAAQAAIDAEEKARQAAYDQQVAAAQKAYEEAVKARDAQVAAERAAQEAAIAQLEQAQRDAQMEMTKAVIDESNQRIAQYEKELRKANDPKEKAELKAKIALERERIDVANQLAGAITAANNATSDFDLSVANAQIEFFTAQLAALDEVDVGGMLQGIADAITAAAEAMAQAADKIKGAFSGGGGKNKGEKDKGGGTQDASDPGLSGGMASGGGGGISQEFDKVGKAARKAGDDVNAGMGVADMAIRKVLGTTLPEYVKGMGDAGTKGGEALGKNASVAIEHGEASMTKTITKSIEGATLNGEKIGADRGKTIGVTISTNMETGVKEREREVTKTVDGVVKDSTDAAVPTAQQGGTKIGDGFITFTSQSIKQGQSKVSGDAKQMMTQVGQQTQQEAQRTGKSVGDDFSKFTAQGINQGERDVNRAGKQIMDGAGREAKRDANKLGKQAGDDMGRGIAEGIKGRQRDAEQAARDVVQAANKAAREAARANSPSKLFMDLGHDLGDGLVIGMQDRRGDAEDAARALIYTPKGLPGGNSSKSDGLGMKANRPHGERPTININGPVNLPNVHNPEEFIAWVENLMRTNGVSAGRG